MHTSRDPHGTQPVLRTGPPPFEAELGLIAVHGRGDTAAGITETLRRGLVGRDVAVCAPQARGGCWYPFNFLGSPERNEAGVASAVGRLSDLVRTLEGAGLPAENLVLAGFSQGACIALEFAARVPRRYGAVVALTGGLLGPPGLVVDRVGSLDGTPVFLGAGDPDPHVPRWRVEESAEVMARLGGAVTLEFYPGLGHTIGGDELAAARAVIASARRDRVALALGG